MVLFLTVGICMAVSPNGNYTTPKVASSQMWLQGEPRIGCWAIGYYYAACATFWEYGVTPPFRECDFIILPAECLGRPETEEGIEAGNERAVRDLGKRKQHEQRSP
jgi:hypothetical protein